jgi:F-type H+-transporting ATPase subunit b
LDSTSLIVLALFTLLFVMLRKLVFQPFLEDVDQRDERTVKMRESARELEERASSLRQDHLNALNDATQAAQEARRELRVEGLHSKEAHVGEAQAAAQASYQEKLGKLRASFEGARKEALSQADDLAKEIASKVLGRNIIWFIAAMGASALFAGEAHAAANAEGGYLFGLISSRYYYDLFNQALTLLVLLGAIIHFAGGQIKANLKGRADELAQEINAAQAAHDQAQELLSKYEGMIAQLESERAELLESYRAQGEEEKARLIEEGEREAERVTKDAQRQLDNELSAMQRDIERELVESSLARAEELILSKLNLTDHNRLTEGYLTELEQPRG